LFWIAAQALCASQYTDINPEAIGDKLQSGIYIRQQAPIGKYRVDFLIEQIGLGPDDIYTPVVVELDGHDFHDKDKRQRSYENERDRFLVKKGFRVLHFTGSDVVADPFRVASEVLEMLCVYAGSGREAYNKDDPMDCGG
jgi:very-short-patch-repair endonuclease